MPELDYGSSFKENRDNTDPQSWQHVYNPLVAIRTLLNTTKLDKTNIQDSGISTDKVAMQEHPLRGNAVLVTGGNNALAAKSLAYFAVALDPPTSYGDAPVAVVAAQAVARSSSGRKYASVYIPSAIDANTTGVGYRIYFEASAGLSGITNVLQPVYLSKTAGEFTSTAPGDGYTNQVVGWAYSNNYVFFDLPGAILTPDYDYGLRPDGMIVRGYFRAGPVFVVAGASIAAKSMVRLNYTTTDPGGGDDGVYATLADATDAATASPNNADAYAPDAISSGSTGVVWRTYLEESSGLDCTGTTTGSHVYLGEAGGSYSLSLPSSGRRVQVVG